MNVAVVGAGVFGVASALELSSRGHTVTVFERGEVPDPNASSTDVSKAIRRTWYGDFEIYVELVERAASTWRTWERTFPARVYHQVGQLLVLEDFEPGSPMYESWRFLRRRGANIEVLTPRQTRSRFPQFTIEAGETCVYDPWAGYLESGQAVLHMARMAEAQGTRLVENAPVTAVEDTPTGVRLSVEGRRFDFDRAVVATGVWLGRLVPALASHLKVTHQQMVFIEVDDTSPFTRAVMPVWSFNPDGGGWYGFPLLREGYLKVAKEAIGEVVDPDLDRQGTPDFARAAVEFLKERIPEMAAGRVVGGRSCLYANTPDDHFVIDRAPGSGRVVVAGGGSGHGFKFGGSIGEIVADVVEERDNPMGHLFRIGDRFHVGPLERPGGTRGFAVPTSG